MMKKVNLIVCILFYAGTVFGQQPTDYILKARALTQAGKPELSISLLTRALSGNNDSRMYSERGEAYIVKGDYSAAIGDFNEANRIIPNSGDFGLSRIYALKGDAATALYHLELSLNSSFKKGEKEIMLEPAFSKIENKPEWRQFWKKERYSSIEEKISEIEYYVASGKTDESKTLLSELKKGYESNDDILYAEALVNFSSGKYNEVINSVSGLAALNPENEKYLRILARAQTAVSNPAGASVTYSQLLSSGVADAELLILRADCYRKTGENDKALSDLGRYLDIYPENKTALSMVGKVKASTGDNLKALEYFTDNLKLHPNDPECYIDRANSYFLSKSWDWAIKDYSMSLDLRPDNSDTWLSKGIALLNSGKTDDACHDFKKSFSLGNKRASEYISNNCIK